MANDDRSVAAAREFALEIANVVTEFGRSTITADDDTVRQWILPVLRRHGMDPERFGDEEEREWPPKGATLKNDIGREIWVAGADDSKFRRLRWKGLKALGLSRMEYLLCEILWLAYPEPLPTDRVVASFGGSEHRVQREDGRYLHVRERPAHGMNPRSVPVVLRRLAIRGLTTNHHAGTNRQGEWTLTARGRERFEWGERMTGHPKWQR